MKTHLRIFFLLLGILTVAKAEPAPGVGFEQRLGARLPADAVFQEVEPGRTRRLGEFFQGRPVVLWFGYARCPQLCSVVADGLVTALRPLAASVGRDFDVVTISIDPEETPAEARASRGEALGHYGRTAAAAGWHYLTGDAAAIRAVTAAAGFHFRYDPRSRQYAHPSGFLVLTPDGKISGYFPGLDFPPKDVAAAIERAKGGGIGQKVADLLLTCFRGEGVGGRYGAIIWRTLGAAVALTVLAVGGGIGWMLARERAALRRTQEERA